MEQDPEKHHCIGQKCPCILLNPKVYYYNLQKRDRMTHDSELNGNRQTLNLVHSKFCLFQGNLDFKCTFGFQGKDIFVETVVLVYIAAVT